MSEKNIEKEYKLRYGVVLYETAKDMLHIKKEDISYVVGGDGSSSLYPNKEQKEEIEEINKFGKRKMGLLEKELVIPAIINLFNDVKMKVYMFSKNQKVYFLDIDKNTIENSLNYTATNEYIDKEKIYHSKDAKIYNLPEKLWDVIIKEKIKENKKIIAKAVGGTIEIKETERNNHQVINIDCKGLDCNYETPVKVTEVNIKNAKTLDMSKIQAKNISITNCEKIINFPKKVDQRVELQKIGNVEIKEIKCQSFHLSDSTAKIKKIQVGYGCWLSGVNYIDERTIKVEKIEIKGNTIQCENVEIKEIKNLDTEKTLEILIKGNTIIDKINQCYHIIIDTNTYYNQVKSMEQEYIKIKECKTTFLKVRHGLALDINIDFVDFIHHIKNSKINEVRKTPPAILRLFHAKGILREKGLDINNLGLRESQLSANNFTLIALDKNKEILFFKRKKNEKGKR